MKDDFEVRLSDVKNVQHHNCLLINLLIPVKFEKVCRHIVEPHHEKTGFLSPMRIQYRRSAVQ